MQYEDASYMRQETGTFVIYSYYHYPDGTIPFLDAFYQDNAQGVETLRLHDPQFKTIPPISPEDTSRLSMTLRQPTSSMSTYTTFQK